jgi:glycosyltransferase involved in cell wall biosynthesis
MKIVYLAAGAGGMYCGSCLHDNTLAASMLSLGEDLLLVPTYTPLRTDEENVSEPRMFFGGINVYLQQHSAFFRHTPWFVDALLDRPGVIDWATKGGPSVDASELGDLTVSMLQGEDGRQRKEIRKLVRWLSRDARPEIVHLSNAMLTGMAREISKLGVKIVCSLSGEDIFLEKLVEPFYTRARDTLRERAGDIDAFVALNQYYADYMIDYLSIPRNRVRVIPHGLNMAGHGTRRRVDGEPPTIGYLARVCHDKGLHNLVNAAELLQKDDNLPPFRIRAGGYLGDADRSYLVEIRRQVARWESPDRFEYVGELTRDEKIAFLQGMDFMSLPTVYRESKGLSVLEALANAVPVVLPDHGAFGEVVRITGGGLLHEPQNPEALAAALRHMLVNPAQAAEFGVRGQQVIKREFEATVMAKRTLDLYRDVVAGRVA